MITVVFCFPKTLEGTGEWSCLRFLVSISHCFSKMGGRHWKVCCFFFRQRTNHLITLGSRGVVVVDVRFDSRTSSTPIAPLSFHTRSLAGGGRWWMWIGFSSFPATGSWQRREEQERKANHGRGKSAGPGVLRRDASKGFVAFRSSFASTFTHPALHLGRGRRKRTPSLSPQFPTPLCLTTLGDSISGRLECGRLRTESLPLYG